MPSAHRAPGKHWFFRSFVKLFFGVEVLHDLMQARPQRLHLLLRQSGDQRVLRLIPGPVQHIPELKSLFGQKDPLVPGVLGQTFGIDEPLLLQIAHKGTDAGGLKEALMPRACSRSL